MILYLMKLKIVKFSVIIFLLGAMGRQHSVLHGCLHHHIYVCICIYVSIITCIMVNANKHSFIHSLNAEVETRKNNNNN